MKRHRWMFGLMAALIATSTTDAATIYTDRPTFEAAAPGLPVEDFEKGLLTNAAGTASNFAQPFSSATDDDAWDPGDVIDGFVLSAIVTGPQGLRLAGPGFLGSVTKQITTVGTNGILVLALSPSVPAFGVDLLPPTGATIEWNVEVFSDFGSLGVTNLPTGGFFGIISDDPIANVVLSQVDNPSATNGFMDNLTFGDPVPEPASGILLLFAVGACVMSTRKRDG